MLSRIRKILLVLGMGIMICFVPVLSSIKTSAEGVESKSLEPFWFTTDEGLLFERYIDFYTEKEHEYLGRLNMRIRFYKLAFDLSEKYDWYSVRWTIQIIPGWSVENNDWRLNWIKNIVEIDRYSNNNKLVKYGPIGDYGAGATTVSVNIGVNAGENGASVTCGLGWQYTKPYNKLTVKDYSDFHENEVCWVHDDVENNIKQTIMIEPGFTFRVPQGETFVLNFTTIISFIDPADHFWESDRVGTGTIYWIPEFYGANFYPLAPVISGPHNGYKQTKYSFSIIGVDPDWSKIKYNIDWNDETNSSTEYHKSYEKVILTHSWDDEGYYNIVAYTIDQEGLKSEPSDSHEIHIAKKSAIGINKPNDPSFPLRDILIHIIRELQKSFPLLYELFKLILSTTQPLYPST